MNLGQVTSLTCGVLDTFLPCHPYFMSDFYVTLVMFLPVFVPYWGNIVFMF